MTSVLIIDDHPIVLQGCRRVLEDAGMEPVLTASDLVAHIGDAVQELTARRRVVQNTGS